jgi:hypothetical protein
MEFCYGQVVAWASNSCFSAWHSRKQEKLGYVSFKLYWNRQMHSFYLKLLKLRGTWGEEYFWLHLDCWSMPWFIVHLLSNGESSSFSTLLIVIASRPTNILYQDFTLSYSELFSSLVMKNMAKKHIEKLNWFFVLKPSCQIFCSLLVGRPSFKLLASLTLN